MGALWALGALGRAVWVLLGGGGDVMGFLVLNGILIVAVDATPPMIPRILTLPTCAGIGGLKGSGSRASGVNGF